MSNSAPNGRFSRLVSTGNTVSREVPRSSVGAGYRSEVRPSQTLKSPKNRFFSGACGHRAGNQRPVAGLPHIGGADPAATTTTRSHPLQARLRQGACCSAPIWAHKQRVSGTVGTFGTGRITGSTCANDAELHRNPLKIVGLYSIRVPRSDKEKAREGQSRAFFRTRKSDQSRSSAIWRRSAKSRFVINTPSARL